mgnify:CR=1 FL=1
MRAWWARRVRAGYCGRCARPQVPGKTKCVRHLQQGVDNQRRLNYGLSPEEYQRLHRAQGGACAICRRRLKLHIDHDHQSGRVRGLLCNSCNNGLGRFADNPERLYRAGDYLVTYYPKETP